MNDNQLSATSARLSFQQRVVLLIGGIGPLGHAPASGTVTVAVVGIPAVWMADRWGVPLWAYVAFTAVLALLGVWVHQIGDRILGEKDSRKLVIDELVGYLVAMTAAKVTWPLLLLGFLLERGLDIAKLWPAGWVERHGPGGWGVVGDDVVAGLYTLILLHAVMAWVPQYVG